MRGKVSEGLHCTPCVLTGALRFHLPRSAKPGSLTLVLISGNCIIAILEAESLSHLGEHSIGHLGFHELGSVKLIRYLPLVMLSDCRNSIFHTIGNALSVLQTHCP